MHRQPGRDCISSEVNHIDSLSASLHWLEHIRQILKLIRRQRGEYKLSFTKKCGGMVAMAPNG